jgi:hypothetical protein
MQHLRSGAARRRSRTVWSSDIHLGFRGSNADFLLEFLHGVECQYLCIVGEIAYYNCGDWVESFTAPVEYRDPTITPTAFRTILCPTYPEIRLASWPLGGVRRVRHACDPHAIHIATEGPLGHAAHLPCRTAGLKCAASFHTQFPEYINMRAPVPLRWS